MNNSVTLNIGRFILLVLIQALVLNNINFLGYINPYIYILFVILYPINNNRMLFILTSFFLGLTVDLFLDSGGVHAAATTLIAYARPLFLKTSSKILLILKKSLFSGIFTVILCLLLTILFSRKTR